MRSSIHACDIAEMDEAMATTSPDQAGRLPPRDSKRVRTASLDRPARQQSQLGLVWRSLKRDKFALIGGAMVFFTLFLAVAAPVVSPHDPLTQNSQIRLSPIGTDSHPLGTDGNGRDILSRLIYGSRTALMVAIVPV